MNKEQIEHHTDKLESFLMSASAKSITEIDEIIEETLEVSKQLLQKLKYDINPLQLLLSKPEPNPLLSLAEYGCSQVYELAVNSPSLFILILRDPKPEDWAKVYDFDNNAIQLQLSYHEMMAMIDWKASTEDNQLQKYKRIREWLIEELTDLEFIDGPKCEMVSIKFKEEKINFSGNGGLLIKKSFWEDLNIYQNLFGSKILEPITQMYLGKSIGVRKLEEEWNKLSPTDVISFIDEFKDDISKWSILKNKYPQMENCVCEFIAKDINNKKYRLQTLLGNGTVILA